MKHEVVVEHPIICAMLNECNKAARGDIPGLQAPERNTPTSLGKQKKTQHQIKGISWL